MAYAAEPHIVGTPNEYKVQNPPQDGISELAFTPVQGYTQLLAASWDSTVRLYDVQGSASNFQKLSYTHTGPVLSVAYTDLGGQTCASGGLDCTLKMYNLVAGAERVVGLHDKPIRAVRFAPHANLILSGSWDSTLRLWDPRTAAAVATLSQPERVYALDCVGQKAVVATAGRKVWLWDLRQTSGPEQRRDSSLKFQTRALRANPDGFGYVLSSIEGRVAVEYFQEGAERRKYAFKCHREKVDGIEQVYPVNAIAFHPSYGTFASGGSDALVNIWDPANKKRLCQFHKYPTSIAALAFSSDGSQLAIGASYQYELPFDPNPIPKDILLVRKLSDQETRPKN